MIEDIDRRHMDRPRKIDRKNLPQSSPLLGTIVLWLALDYWNAPGWLWGVIGTLVVVLWLAFIAEVSLGESVDVLKK